MRFCVKYVFDHTNYPNQNEINFLYRFKKRCIEFIKHNKKNNQKDQQMIYI